MRNKNVTIRAASPTAVLNNSAPSITEEQLDWVEQLKPAYLVVGPTRIGKTRPPALEFSPRAIQQGGKDDDQV